MRRQIIYAKQFDADADEWGGYIEIDVALDTVIEALSHDPYAFPKFETDFVSFRYALTKRIRDMPPLAFMFTIDDRGNVTLERIFEAYLY
jgi:hypothetical protein